jgi:hypothetical protein
VSFQLAYLFSGKEAKKNENTKEEIMAKLKSLKLETEEDYSTDNDSDMSEHSDCGEC